MEGIALGTLLCIPVWSLFMLIGTLCWVFYKNSGGTLPGYVQKADQVFPFFITTHIPPGVAGLFLAALFGAAMANLSSDFNSLAAIFVEDYYRPLKPVVLRPPAPARGKDCGRVRRHVVHVVATVWRAVTEALSRCGTPYPLSSRADW